MSASKKILKITCPTHAKLILLLQIYNMKKQRACWVKLFRWIHTQPCCTKTEDTHTSAMINLHQPFPISKKLLHHNNMTKNQKIFIICLEYPTNRNSSIKKPSKTWKSAFKLTRVIQVQNAIFNKYSSSHHTRNDKNDYNRDLLLIIISPWYKMNKKLSFRPRFLWVDLEMSGLDPKVNQILEFACIITDEHLKHQMEGPHLIIHADKQHLDQMDEWNTTYPFPSEATTKSRDSTPPHSTALSRQNRPKSQS